MIIIRGLAGVMIGVAYGFLVSGIVFLLTRINLDTSSSSQIIDPLGMARFVTFLAGLIAGVCAVLVGLIVGIARMDGGNAAITGVVTGVIAIGLIFISSSPIPNSLSDWIGLLVTIALLPIGLALIGMVMSIIANRF
jgi:hypothetical protein